MLSIFGEVALDYNKVQVELNKIKEDSSNGIDQLIGNLG